MNSFLTILLASAITISVLEDLKHQKIPNLVTFPTMVMALGYHAIAAGWNGFWFSLAGLGTGMGLFIIPYIMGGMGAGDVKLMMALGAILGVHGIIITSILVILCGGVYGLVLFSLNPGYAASFLRRCWMTLKSFALTFNFVPIPPEPDYRPLVLKYAIPIALGAGGYMLMQITGYDLFLELLGNNFRILSIAP